MMKRTFPGAASTLALQARFEDRKPPVSKVCKSPGRHPNALETKPGGFWIGERPSNASWVDFGAVYLRMAANGKAIGRNKRPTDASRGEIIKADPQTARTVARYPVPGGGGIDGREFTEGKLWIRPLKLHKLTQVDPASLQIVYPCPIKLSPSRGFAWDRGAIWPVHSAEREIHKLDANDAKLLDKIVLSKDAPGPHDMCLGKKHRCYCGAGIAVGANDNGSPAAGYVCRIDF